jgi:hypothetical protein
MQMLARMVKAGDRDLANGLGEQIGDYCRNILADPNATPEQRGYAANVGRAWLATCAKAAHDLDPMEVSEGLHQAAAGVEVTEGETTKVEATYTFKVTIS